MHYLGRSERKRTGRPLLAALRQWVEVLRGKANGGTDLFAIGSGSELDSCKMRLFTLTVCKP